ncbi:hypothetical protein [Streptomyces lancefieldiae]|uniref:Secreted protein n=1 Tax=Streptomyces lancefieldiae TaxID=3075520 RepID=A0ABU3AQQ2_9ACTN|nr:hypothetical protein [Streptomyces sp. DSM 40712]MDT0612150.1 hypothetical protein [Streptomyces sp. DSM 40712]
MRSLRTRMAGVCAAVAFTGLLAGTTVAVTAPTAAAAAVDYDCDDEPVPSPADPEPGQSVTLYADQCHRVPGDPGEDVLVFSEYYDAYWRCERVEERGGPGTITGYDCVRDDEN